MTQPCAHYVYPMWMEFNRTARKVQPMMVKHMTAVIADSGTMAHFLLKTIEGEGPVRENAMFCMGAAGDVWLQDPAKVIAKYDLTKVAVDGWMEFTPKPDVAVDFCEFTMEMVDLCPKGIVGAGTRFYIVGQWGSTVNGIDNCQEVRIGDIVARNQKDPTDQWVVARKIWDNSYVEDKE